MRWQTEKSFLLAVLLGTALWAAEPLRVLHTAAGGRVKTLDPAQADDLASRNMVGALYDTLLQYDYTARPYRLQCSMLAEMPHVNPAMDAYSFRLRDDLYFAENPAFAAECQSLASRKITSRDVRYSILRIADLRNHSPLWWLFAGKIQGLDEFHRQSGKCRPGDDSLYQSAISGFVIKNDLEFEIRLTKPDPRFLYMLAMPNAGIVPEKAVRFYGADLARHPAGSGPFVLKNWVNDYKLELVRNPAFRKEFFPAAETPADRTRPLPLLDKVICCQIKQPFSAWLLFLQGKLDYNTLDKDNLDLVAGGGETLSPALARRGVKLLRTPEFEVRYVGMSFSDPRLAGNENLRKALSLAYNVSRRVRFTNHQLIPAQTPIPPGVAGFDGNYRNAFAADDVELAKQYLAKAGFPGGIDPATGKALCFTFDQTGNAPAYRQLGELAASDFAKIGIKVIPVLNNNPRFYEKLRQGKLQLFRLSWVGDYPDAENFLQLFYGKNVSGCNRAGFSDPVYDRMFEEVLPMADSPERTEKYRKMAQYVAEKCPWILEGFPVSYQLNQSWLENYYPHDFAFSRLKYLSLDPEKREKARSQFRPLNFSELNGK